MGGFGRGFVAVEGSDVVENLVVDCCVAFSGAQEVEPGLHEEGLVEVLGVGGIAVDAPADSAVTEADVAELVDGLGEFGVVFGGDAVVDGDTDGAVGGLLLDAGDGDDLRGGALPLVGCEVGDRTLQNVEALDDGVG